MKKLILRGYNIKTIILLIVSAIFLLSCNQQTDKTNQIAHKLQGQTGSCSSESNQTHSNILFKLDGRIITTNDLDSRVKDFIYQTEQAAFSKKEAILKEYALRLFLAKKKGLPTDSKNLANITELISTDPVSDLEARDLFEKNKNRMPPGSTFEKMKPQIIAYLKNTKIKVALEKQLKILEAKGIFSLLFTGPTAPTMTIDTTGFPVKGNKKSSIKVIEISDYKCGHCQHAHPQVLQLFKKYKSKISFTQINFSLRPSAISGTYIRGAYCAALQGEEDFWKYHDEAFRVNTKPHEHTPGHKHSGSDGESKESLAEVSTVAKSISLDMNKFKTCLSSKEAHQFVQKTNKMLSSNGINSTPTFLINNKKIEKGIHGLEEAIKTKL